MIDLRMASSEKKDFCLNCQRVFDRKSRHLIQKLAAYEKKIEKLNQKIASQKLKLTKSRKIENGDMPPKLPASHFSKPVDLCEKLELYAKALKAPKPRKLKKPVQIQSSDTASTPFDRAFTEKFGKVAYKELDNEIIEKRQISTSALQNMSLAHQAVESARRALKLAAVELRPAKHPMLYDLRLKGASQSVRSAAKEVERVLKIRVRKTRRFLLFPAQVVAQLDLAEVARLSSAGVASGGCSVRATAKGGKSRFGEGLWGSGLGQVELVGPVEACDAAEERIAAFVKLSLNEHDAEFDLELKTVELTFALAKDKILQQTGCEITKEVQRGLERAKIYFFAGAKTKLKKAISVLENIFNNSEKNEICELIPIPAEHSDLVDAELVKSLLRLGAAPKLGNAAANAPGVRIVGNQVALTVGTGGAEGLAADENNDFKCGFSERFLKVVEFLAKSITPAASIPFDSSKRALLSAHKREIEADSGALLRLAVSVPNRSAGGVPPDGGKAVALVFGGEGESLKAAAAVRRVLRAAPRRSVAVAAFAAGMLRAEGMAAVEGRFGVVLSVAPSWAAAGGGKDGEGADGDGKDGEGAGGGDGAAVGSGPRDGAAVEVYAVGGEDAEMDGRCERAADAVGELVKNLLNRKPTLIANIPLTRTPLLTQSAIAEIEQRHAVKVKHPIGPKHRSDADAEPYGLFGALGDCSEAQRRMDEKCLLNVEPSLELPITAEKARIAFWGQGGEFAAEVEKATGALIFLRRGGGAGEEGEMATAVQFYGNEYACAAAAKMLDEIHEKNSLLRCLMVPTTDLVHIRADGGKKLRRLERKTRCAVHVPPAMARDPLDSEVRIGIFGTEGESQADAAEKGVRGLTSLLSKVENRVSRVIKTTRENAAGLERNDSKLLFLIQNETHCVLTVLSDNDAFQTDSTQNCEIKLRGSMATCDAAEDRINQI